MDTPADATLLAFLWRIRMVYMRFDRYTWYNMHTKNVAKVDQTALFFGWLLDRSLLKIEEVIHLCLK